MWLGVDQKGRVHIVLSQLVDGWAEAQPERPALLALQRPALTYAELARQMHSVAQALTQAGASPPDAPVATLFGNGIDAAVSFLAVTCCAPCVALSPRASIDELRFCLDDSDARVLLWGGGVNLELLLTAQQFGVTLIEFDSVLRSLEPTTHVPRSTQRAPNDVALMLHTSGTTARPKLVPLTQANLVASATRIATHLALQPADRCLNVMPLFHIHGLVGVLLASLAAGASVVCSPGFDATCFVDWVERFQPTWYSAVPTIHQSVLGISEAYRRRLPQHRFRFIRSSSAALSPSTLHALEAATGAPVVEAYGMTEAAHQMASNPLPPGLRKPGSVGPSAGAQIAVVDAAGHALATGAQGEVVVRGPGVMASYGGRVPPSADAFVDGWFRTGDLGHLDADGYLFISGRLKEIINRGGEKISPREVDDAVLEHADVTQTAAFAVEHPTLGEDLVAAVVRMPGSDLTEAALRQFLFSRLAAHKVPSRIVFVEAIPKGPTGKVQRHTLPKTLAPWLAVAYEAPADDTQRAIETVLRQVLQSDAVGLRDNFFSLGGDSLKAMQAVALINQRHGVQLAAAALFHHPTIGELATVVDAAQAAMRQQRALIQSEIDALSDSEVERLLAEAQALQDAQASRSGPGGPASM